MRVGEHIPLSGRHIAHLRNPDKYVIYVPPAVGRALEKRGIKTVDVVIIVPDKEASSNQ